MIARKLKKVNPIYIQFIFFHDIYLKTISMNKRKIILITEKQAKMLINQVILESKKYKG